MFTKVSLHWCDGTSVFHFGQEIDRVLIVQMVQQDRQKFVRFELVQCTGLKVLKLAFDLDGL